MGHATPDLEAIASRFDLPAAVTSVSPLGNGNVNDTYQVDTASGERFVLQRLNTLVFPEPELVMGNLQVLTDHVQSKGERAGCQLPTPIALCGSRDCLLRGSDGSAWRLISFIADAHCVDALKNPAQAEQIGRGLGRFHALVHDLPTNQLHDTLEGFHVTPRYLSHYRQVLSQTRVPPCPESEACQRFVAERLDLVPVLEEALLAGQLKLRPIHGDPKVNNVMLCQSSGRAIALVDLDAVKPGLLHTDIGDCLRSACNLAGEECTDLEAVSFNLELAKALLQGYLAEAGRYLSEADHEHLYDAIHLLPFELGLRFLTDYLDGDIYFKTQYPRQNLNRARVQFRLTESIEAQELEIREILAQLTARQP